MTEPITLKTVIPNIPDIELVALEGLDRLARHLGISEEKIGEARILVTEAIINSLEHAGQGQKSVEVEFTMTSEDITIFVRDQGPGFDAEKAVEKITNDPDPKMKKRGWGLRLMKSLSDDFKIESGAEGTKITIRKSLR